LYSSSFSTLPVFAWHGMPGTTPWVAIEEGALRPGGAQP